MLVVAERQINLNLGSVQTLSLPRYTRPIGITWKEGDDTEFLRLQEIHDTTAEDDLQPVTISFVEMGEDVGMTQMYAIYLNCATIVDPVNGNKTYYAFVKNS